MALEAKVLANKYLKYFEASRNSLEQLESK